MAEHADFARDIRHHQQKIVLFFAAMRAHADRLHDKGFKVHYQAYDAGEQRGYFECLEDVINDVDARKLVHFEIEDMPVEQKLVEFAEQRNLERCELASPMFLCSRERFRSFADGKTELRMADFYRQERRRLNILVQENGEPTGGRWSFDDENRKKLPKTVEPPDIPTTRGGEHVSDVTTLVEKEFADHPGDATDFAWPATRRSALYWLNDFLEQRFDCFGPYEDAISSRSDTVFHSVLSPVINLGLITPQEIVEAALDHAEKHDTPIQSVEGFVRQVIGWREFIRGTYRHFGNEQKKRNHWHHSRRLTDAWYDGDTGLPPLDDAIAIARKRGWTHHIQRLMVVANLMTLCEIAPREAYRWFMEMFVDAAEWVMVPNVFGMGLFSDGGIFATKPYICGSNYLRKMSDYPKGDWCDTVDGLYWRFIDKNRKFFATNPRLSLMPSALDRLDDDRRQRIFSAADEFIEQFTDDSDD